MLLPYVIRCHSCARGYDALRAQLCKCVVKRPTTACPSCGACLCNASETATNGFWRDAPPEMLERVRRDRRALPSVIPAASGEAPAVMVVDDDEEIRLVAAHVITSFGYRVIAASGAEQALQLLETERPSIVLTDAFMPKVDGRQLCKMIKLRSPRVKVVIMTSLYRAPRYKTEAFRTFHADGYLTKPINFSELEEVLRRLEPQSKVA
jgi:CheY-like chemotaxis protein